MGHEQLSEQRSNWYELTPWLRIPAAYCAGVGIPVGTLLASAYILAPLGVSPGDLPFLVGLGVPVLAFFLRGLVTVLLVGRRWRLHGLVTVALIACEATVLLTVFGQWRHIASPAHALLGMAVVLASVFWCGGAAFLGAFVGGKLVPHGCTMSAEVPTS